MAKVYNRTICIMQSYDSTVQNDVAGGGDAVASGFGKLAPRGGAAMSDSAFYSGYEGVCVRESMVFAGKLIY